MSGRFESLSGRTCPRPRLAKRNGTDESDVCNAGLIFNKAVQNILAPDCNFRY